MSKCEWKAFTKDRKASALELAKRADWLSAQQGKDIAQGLSSGAYSSTDLAKAGHPYARRRPNPAFDPAIINKQTGKFRNSWRIRIRSFKRNPIIENTDPKAKLLEKGTRKMVARPIDMLTGALLLPIRLRNLVAAFRERFRSH